MILKIILFIVAFLIVALLVILLIVLLIPVRYQLSCCHLERESCASGKISWFFHLLSFRFSYKKGSGLSYSLRVLRFVLFGSEAAQKTGRRKSGEKKIRSGHVKKKKVRQKTTGGSQSPVRSSAPESPRPSVLPEKSSEDRETAKESRSNAENSKPSVPVVPKKTEKDRNFEKKPEIPPGGFQKLCGFLREKWNRFREICSHLLSFIRNLTERAKDLREKFHALKSRISYYLDILKSEEMKAYLKKARILLIRLLKHVRPRKAEGYLHYGLEDPSMTGILTGILYLLQPVNMQGILLKPDFDQALFRGEFLIAGRVRLCHIFVTALRLFFDKNRKIIWKQLKKGGK